MVEELECLVASGLQAEVLQLQAGLLWDRLVPQVKRESRDARVLVPLLDIVAFSSAGPHSCLLQA